ncbi:MAG TPA: glycosyltransferase family 4 protein [Nitrospira sp.]|nr:glycosyltransferase family 4 protein [Nitrospira sp.]
MASIVDTICHIITKLELGGAQEVALHVVSHLDRTKYRAILITGPGGLLTEEAQRIPHVEVRILPALGRQIYLFDDLAALVQLTTLLRRIRPSIVHTHSSKAGILGRWAAWFAGIPVIIHTIHGYGITPVQSRWVQRLLVMVERMTGWITTQWVAVSKADIRKGRTWRLFRNNVQLVRPGIDPRPFLKLAGNSDRNLLRRELGAPAGTRLIGTVACLKPQKAPEDFIEVAKLVSVSHPNVRFVLIGDGELRTTIESLIARYGLHDHVQLTGWRRDVPAILQALDIFLLTSHWEGLPRVLLEARVVGLPIVATNVGGADEVVVEAAVGALCQAGDIEGMATAVTRILSYGTASANANSAEPPPLPYEFHIDETVRQYQQLYDQLLEKYRDSRIPPRAIYSQFN